MGQESCGNAVNLLKGFPRSDSLISGVGVNISSYSCHWIKVGQGIVQLLTPNSKISENHYTVFPGLHCLLISVDLLGQSSVISFGRISKTWFSFLSSSLCKIGRFHLNREGECSL